MNYKLPKEVRDCVRAAVYSKADEFNYMYRDRIDSGQFMENLVRDESIGGMLSDYMEKGKIKTYIKDGVLNRYMKEKRSAALPSDTKQLANVIKDYYQKESHHIASKNSAHLFRLSDDALVIIVQGTVVKWETALRKALLFIERSPGLPPPSGALHVLLNLAALANSMTTAERDHLKRALRFINTDINFAT